MLRKKHVVKGKNVVGGSERKQLRERCLELYGLAARDGDDAAELEEQLAASFFPKKSGQVVELKWQYPSPHVFALVYVVQDVPLCVELSTVRGFDNATEDAMAGGPLSAGNERLMVPTVFGFLRLRQLLQTRTEYVRRLMFSGQSPEDIETSTGSSGALLENVMLGEFIRTRVPSSGVVWTHAPTSSFVLRGAHLMIPGVIAVSPSQSGAAAASGIVLVCAKDHAVPYAVGVMTPKLAAACRNPSITTAVQPAGLPGRQCHVITRLPESQASGVAVIVVNALGDLVWEGHESSYRSASSIAFKVASSSEAILPKAFSDAVAKGVIPENSGTPGLLAFLLSSKTNNDAKEVDNATSDAADGTTEAAASLPTDGVVAASDASAPDGVDHHDGSEAASKEGEEPLPEAGADEDDAEEEGDAAASAWSLFPDEVSVLTFAFATAVLELTKPQLPMPLTSFINAVCQSYPRGLPLMPSSEPNGALQALVSKPIDFKATSFKKSLTFIQHVCAGGDTLTLKESAPGVHQIVKFNKGSEVMRAFKRKFMDFVSRVHGPAMEQESVQKYLDSLERDSGKKQGGAASVAVSLPSVRIASMDIVYRPQNGFHPMLQQVLVRGRIPSSDGTWSATNAEVEGESSGNGDDSEEDQEDSLPSHVVTAKHLRDNLRSYIAARNLLQVNAANPHSKPDVRIDELLRSLWDGQSAPYSVPIDEIDKKVLYRFCPMHMIRYAPLSHSAASGKGGSKGSSSVSLPSYMREKLKNGKPATVQVYTEKRCGNKVVTIVRGLDALGFSLEAVSYGWKSQFATSVNIFDPMKESQASNLKSGTKLRREIHLQGPFKAELEAHLSGVLGVPRSLISLTKH